jgi:hypothetical protein
MRLRQSGCNPCTPFDGVDKGLGPDTLTAMRDAIASGCAAEMQLICVKRGCHDQKICRFLIQKVVETVNKSNAYSHLFVELSPMSVNGTRLSLLQHALEVVFGFTRLTLVPEAMTYWYVCRLDATPTEKHVSSSDSSVMTTTTYQPKKADGFFARCLRALLCMSSTTQPVVHHHNVRRACPGVGWRTQAVSSTFLSHDLKDSVEGGELARLQQELREAYAGKDDGSSCSTQSVDIGGPRK